MNQNHDIYTIWSTKAEILTHSPLNIILLRVHHKDHAIANQIIL
jgi:hypothetical protein